MEENKNSEIKEEEFKDFDEDYADDGQEDRPELDEDLVEDDIQDDNINQENQNEPIETNEEIEIEDKEVINTQEEKETEIKTEDKTELSLWEEHDKNKNVVKKYIFEISKDLIFYLDKKSPKERNAYINSAIRLKIDNENIEKQKKLKICLFTHALIIVLIFIFATPFILKMTNTAFMLTFKNYKYSQENFEKLYKERFLNNKAYLRSIQYNQKHSNKK